MIDGLLSYARIGRVPLQPEVVDAGRVVAEVLELLAPPAHVAVVAPELPVLRTERAPLQ